MKKLHFFKVIPFLFILMTFSCRNEPVQLYKANPHYFSYKGKPLVLITSDHHYGAVIDQDFDFTKYLDYLADQGMNLTRIYPGAMYEPTDKYIRGNPLGPKSGRQLLPWKRTDMPGANPSLSEPGEHSFKYDLESWNPRYFDRLKTFVELACKKDIIVEIAFFNGMYADCWPRMALYHGNNIQQAGRYEAPDCGLFTTMDERNTEVVKYQKEYIKKIVRELNAYDNIIYDICDEPSLQGLPVGSIVINPDSLISPWISAMKEAFLQAEESLPKKHLLGQTVQNLSPDFSGELWCQWLPAEYVKPGERALKLNYQANKPIMNVESNYFGSSLTRNAYTADAVRIEGWWFMLGGGAGTIHLNGEYFRGNETGGEVTRNQIVPQRKILKDFMDGLDLTGLTRSVEIIKVQGNAIYQALVEPGKQYALYLFHGSHDDEWGANFILHPGHYIDTLTIHEVPAGVYKLQWLDPATGDLKASGIQNWDGGNLMLITPSYEVDIALMIRKTK